MTIRQVVEGLYQLSYQGVNAFLVDDGDRGLALIDTGYPKHAPAIEKDMHSIGADPSQLTHIIITHAHPDHLGSAKHFSRGTIPVAIHPGDTDVARAGIIHQTMKPGPGLMNKILFKLLIGSKPYEFPAFEPQASLGDGVVLSIAGGLEVIHTPGHTAGHVSLLWRRDRRLLFTGDAAGNVMGLNYMLGYNDLEEGSRSLRKLGGLDFEAAVFGHGKPILENAAAKFARKFGRP
ncbi:MAG: MBL fold metallo-hydrolase [Acidimicrobiia bacterium]